MTFLELQDAVLFNAFAERYRTPAKGYLNRAVREVWRRLELGKQRHVLPYAVGGIVTPVTDLDLLRVDEVWTATGPTATGDAAFNTQSQRRLIALDDDESSADVSAWRGPPLGYQLRLSVPADTAGGTGLGLVSQIVVSPARTAGFVAVSALIGPGELMAADDDASPLGPELDDTLIAFARQRCFQSEDDFENAANWNAEFERGLRAVGLAKLGRGEAAQTPGSHL